MTIEERQENNQENENKLEIYVKRAREKMTATEDKQRRNNIHKIGVSGKSKTK